MITVHLIGNAHIDPVWLWRRPAGLVEAISTCRTAADLLEDFPEFVFTRSDMWLYERIEELEPVLFDRIRRFVKQGSWQPVGGWYIQPDCNLPTAESFRRHIAMGKAYFHSKLGMDVTVGYNVDSFGHAATLPRFLSEAGYDSYVMMRPMKHEMDLPSPLFRWKCGEAEVVTWRIPRGYTTSDDDLTEHIEASLEEADPRVGHVMCFYGVGDHGGGPTRAQLQWISDHRRAFPDAELIFSHPRRFFDAVMPIRDLLPVVEEELQYHAIGCYSAVVDIKQAMRRAEHGLLMAEAAEKGYPETKPEETTAEDAAADSASEILQEAWKKVLFNQFHDIYAGSSIEPACRDALNQLGSAAETAQSIITDIHLKRMIRLPPDPRMRIVAFNPSDAPFNGYLQHEPWTGGKGLHCRLVDEHGTSVPVQIVRQPLIVARRDMLLWKTEMPPQGVRVYRILPHSEPPATGEAGADIRYGRRLGGNDFWIAETGRRTALLHLMDPETKELLFSRRGLHMEVLQDHSDTWSHGIPGFGEKRVGAFRMGRCVIEETGPLRDALRVDAAFGCSRVSLWVRLYRESPEVEIRVHLDWRERLRLVKLVLPFAAPVQKRVDGIPGGSAVRPQNGREFPFTDWTSVCFQADASRVWKELGLAAPDCFSLDGIGNSVRMTLCRSPAYAWHDPAEIHPLRFYRWTDRGEHDFRFVLTRSGGPETLQHRALALHCPPVCYDWPAGMRDGNTG